MYTNKVLAILNSQVFQVALSRNKKTLIEEREKIRTQNSNLKCVKTESKRQIETKREVRQRTATE